MTESCPRCDYEGDSRMALGVHWSKIGHEGLPPYKRQTCDWCETEFARCDSQMTEDGSYCSERCYGKSLEAQDKEEHSSWKEEVTVSCDNCGDDVTLAPSRVDRYRHHFCTRECFDKFMRLDGIYTRYYGKNWEEQREKVLKRDNYTCTYDGCSRTECTDGRELHVHHITPFSSFESYEKANRVENLRTLCAEHHRIVETDES